MPFSPSPSPFSACKATPSYDRYVVAGEPVARKQVAHLKLDQVQKLRVVNGVHLVHEDDHRRHAHLAGEQYVLAGLRHGAVRCGDDQYSAVHLGGARDHVLDVVGVARAVDVSVVAVGGLVLDVSSGDGDAASLLLGSVVDGVEGAELYLGVMLGQYLGDSGSQGGLAVVDVADGADVDVWFRAIKLLFSHSILSSFFRAP